MNRNTKLQLGYTLIELLVVISIMQLFASMILVAANKAKIRGDYARAQSDLRNIRQGIELMQQETGKLPFGCAPGQAADKEILLSLPESGLFTKPVPQAISGRFIYDMGLHDTAPGLRYSDFDNTPIDGNCVWTPEDVSMWNGPYVKSDKLTDPWKWPYIFDRDYSDPWDSTKVYVAIMSWGPPNIGNSKKQIAIPLTSFSTNPIQLP